MNQVTIKYIFGDRKVGTNPLRVVILRSVDAITINREVADIVNTICQSQMTGLDLTVSNKELDFGELSTAKIIYKNLDSGKSIEVVTKSDIPDLI